MSQMLHFVYDDRAQVPDAIAAIVGERSFGSIVRNRRPLCDWVIDCARDAGIESVIRLDDDATLADLGQRLQAGPESACYIHFSANAAVTDRDGLILLLRKIGLADGTLFNTASDPLIAGFHSASAYQSFLDIADSGRAAMAQDFDPGAQLVLPDDAVVDLRDIATFLTFLSGGFETRHFNRVQGAGLTVVKQSHDVAKIEAEYRFANMLPEAMRRWFVQPYGFQGDGEAASYEMERLRVADMAIIWIHGAIDLAGFEAFLDQVFHFLDHRESKTVAPEVAAAQAQALYVEKLRERLAALKAWQGFARLDGLVRDGTGHDGLESLVAAYEERYRDYVARRGKTEPRAVIGHGDLCFSNILHDKATQLTKFVDPRGAMDEAGMWSDPDYDIAKLSHSIFGNYDFMNNNLFTIEIDETLDLALRLETPDISAMQAAFQRRLEARGIDVYGVRLREASLFLSMLPLHQDDSRKVLAFVLNAAAILDELAANG